MNAPIRLRVLPQILPINGRIPEFQVTASYIQYRYAATNILPETAWVDLVPLSMLVGPVGPGTEFQYAGGYIQFRPEGSSGAWSDLISVSDLTSGISDEVQALHDETEDFRDQTQGLRDEAIGAVQMAYGGLFVEAVASGSYTPVAADRNTKLKYVDFATQATVTISDATSALFAVGDFLFFMAKTSSVIFVGSGSVTIAVAGGQIARTAGVDQLCWLQKKSSTVWIAGGALANPRLDSLIQTVVLDRDLTAPPGSPAYLDRYIPKATSTGVWAGQENKIAVYTGMPGNGGWLFLAPQNGWTASVADEGVVIRYTGAGWVALVDSASGTWAPAFGDISATPNMATLDGAATGGTWTKTGKTVRFTSRITLTSKGSMVAGTQAAVYLTDLIAQVGQATTSSFERATASVGFYSNVTLTANTILDGFMLIPTRVGMYLKSNTSGAASATSSMFTDTSVVYCNGSYTSTT